MDRSSSIPRPSGIPRPSASRLPVLRSASSQSQLRTPTPSSTEQLRKRPSLRPVSSLSQLRTPTPAATEQLRRKPSVPSLSRPGPQSTLHKKPSRASLARSTAPSNAPSAAPVSSTRRTEPAFKRPYARPPSRQAWAAQPQLQRTTSNLCREDDALGSLDGFRSASRAGSRAGYRDDEPEPTHALQNEPEGHVPLEKKKSRPSLSERTIESLSQLPSSPAHSKRRRRSSFFSADNSMPPPLRPASAMSSNGSRPNTSDGTFNAPATPKRVGTSSGRLSVTAPGVRSASANVGTPACTPSKTPSLARPTSTAKKQPLSSVLNGQDAQKPRPLSNSKSMVARTPKSRPSIGGVFGQAASPPETRTAAPPTPSPLHAPTKRTPLSSRNVSNSSIALREQIAKAKASRKSDVAPEATPEDSQPSPKANSSNALREQIAKAREAARRVKAAESVRTCTPPRDPIVPAPEEIASFDFGLDDPFNQAKAGKSLLRKRIDAARVDGRLNMAAMGLKDIPDHVLHMYKYDPNDTTVAWGELVDLTSIIAADNELEVLPAEMFPDVDMQDLIDSDEGGPQFGGVQNLDLHGNILRELPMGLRRVTQLSRLNLSRNNLSMDVIDILSDITSLRELRLAENDLQGDLPSVISKLSGLEVLDVQGNKLTRLPEEIRSVTRLRSLNVSSNQLCHVPMALFETNLLELIANKNRLDGAFFSISSIPHLQELDISNNSLHALSEGERLDLPALKSLHISTNRLSSLPNVESWTSLQTLIVAENKLSSFPDGFSSLPELRTADFTANDITHIDEKIALMSLDHLTLAANPLRERKFLTMSFDDIKRDLSARLARGDPSAGDGDAADLGSDGTIAAVQGWQVAPSGTLDLSSKSLTTVDESALSPVADSVRHLNLSSNSFNSISSILATIPFLTVLDLSKNRIATILSTPLTLPRLKDLRLSSNSITSLDPLIANLTAPSLSSLDISNNRLTHSLPALRTAFPCLISLLAADNALSDASAAALQGLTIVNLSNNSIERLDPRIGLLDSLKSLNVEGNVFRVPSWHVLQRGTEAVLAWLRDRVPAGEDVGGSAAEKEEMEETKAVGKQRESWQSSSTVQTVFWDPVDGERGVGVGVGAVGGDETV